MTIMFISKILILLLIMGVVIFILRGKNYSIFIKILSIVALSSWFIKIIIDAYFRWQFMSLETSTLSTTKTLIIIFEAIRILSFFIIGIALKKKRPLKSKYDVEETRRKLIERKRLLDMQNK